MTNTTPSNQPHSSSHSSSDDDENSAPPPVMIRRREKRRHVTESSVDLRDPLEILSLAIRLDEATGDEDILLEPLERGQLYSHSQETFFKAMVYLEEQTISNSANTSRRRRRQRRITTNNNKQSRRPALTPIILSGLIAGQMKLQQQQQDSSSSLPLSLPSPTEMIQFCNVKRRQALCRLQQQKQRNRTMNYTIVVGVVCLLMTSQWQTMRRMQHALVELEYVGQQLLVDDEPLLLFPINLDENYNDNLTGIMEEIPLQPCSVFAGNYYEDACHVAETRLWTFLEDYALQGASRRRRGGGGCTMEQCEDTAMNIIYRQIYKLPGRVEEGPYDHGPYAMHTVLFREETFLDKGTMGRIRASSVNYQVGWLGNSLLNHYVQTTIKQDYIKSNHEEMPFRVLDVGCGVGGLLYTLMPKQSHDGSILFENLDYTGIAISAPEIRTARMLRDEHGIDSSHARFFQMSFDDPRLADTGPYDIIVATESLAYSKNIIATMQNLKSLLYPQGMIIIFDDVEHGPRSNRTSSELVGMRSRLHELSKATGRSTLLTHTEWEEIFEKMKFKVLFSSDAGLHDSLPLLVSDGETPRMSDLLYEAGIKMTHKLPGSERWTAFLLNTLQRLEDWTRGGGGSGKSNLKSMAAARTMQLIREEVRANRANKLRKAALERADTTYNQYNIRSNG